MKEEEIKMKVEQKKAHGGHKEEAEYDDNADGEEKGNGGRKREGRKTMLS